MFLTNFSITLHNVVEFSKPKIEEIALSLYPTKKKMFALILAI